MNANRNEYNSKIDEINSHLKTLSKKNDSIKEALGLITSNLLVLNERVTTLEANASSGEDCEECEPHDR